MKNTHLGCEGFPPFETAMRLWDVILELVSTDSRLVNERLNALGLRLLTHTSSAAVESSATRRRTLHFGRVALMKLAAIVEAGRRAALISDAQARRTRDLMLAVEEQIAIFSTEQPQDHPVPSTPEQAPAAPDVPSTTAEDLSDDVLADLRELADRDSPPEDTVEDGSELGLDPGG